jgi:predicted RecB family nuclease
MVVTKELFAAYLNCQSKAYLKGSATSYQQTRFATWRSDYEDNLRRRGVDFLKEQNFPNVMENPTAVDLSTKGLVLYINWSIDAGEFNSQIDAVEKIDLRGERIRWLPCRCQLDKRAERHEKLLLAYDALCLQAFTGVPIGVGKLIDGAGTRAKKVQLQSFLKVVQDTLPQLIDLLRREKEPPLILNKHCVECEFRQRCREKAKGFDDLSLLSKMSIKEREKLGRKGIFTVKQLSYTFRPRRRRRSPDSKVDKFSYPLKALAIRENKIHVAGAPTFTSQGDDCLLDVEGIPDSEFYYLIGLRFCLNGRYVQHSFWARDRFEEEKIWKNLLDDLRAHKLSRIVHFGSYERRFLETMSKRYCNSRKRLEYVEKLIEQSVNLLSVIYRQIYFPTYSNSLKDIAQYLGHRWPDEISNGYEGLLARHHWEASGEENVKASLVSYNASDCEGLQLIAQCVSQLCGQLSTVGPREDSNFVDTNKLRGWGPFKFGPLNCAIPEFEHINRASYWDYQRERIVFRSHRLSRGNRRHAPMKPHRCPMNKTATYRCRAVCPKCKSRKIYKWGPRRKTVYDLKFSPAGVKRWVIKYRFARHKCRTCRKTFMPPKKPWTRSKYGNGLIRFLVYLTVDLQISQRAARKFIDQFFGIDLSRGSVGRFKKSAADFYKSTYNKIFRNLVQSPLVHVDETKVSLNGRSEYVWVLANQEHVGYFGSQNREGEKLQGILKRFKGVLVSDFYSVYDSFECPQQKCLIHLMRDLNDDLLREPFNEELKSVANGFAFLVKSIVETIDRYGLKCRFMRKHKREVTRFYRWLSKTRFGTEVGVGYKKRFEKNKEKLFTFLDYDDVPWNNNAAEHAIKAFATLRRVFGGGSTDTGIQEYLILLSVCETCRYRRINFWEFLCSGCKDVDTYFKGHLPHRRRFA